MTFVHPWVLLFLAVPVVLFWAVLGRGAGLVLPFDHQTHQKRTWLRWVLGVFETAPLLLLAVALVVLAGPQMLKRPKGERSLTNIQICMDVSGSMVGESYRMASEAITEFTKAREGDAFGLTIFGTAQMRWIPLTKDLSAIRNAMPFANPENQPPHMGGTAIGAALKFCKDNMDYEALEGDRLIVLVSDGASFDLGNGEEYEVADTLSQAKITVYYIHVGNADMPSETAELARLTGGEGMAANDTSALKAVFNHIDRMKPARILPAGTAPLDHFYPFAIAALCLAGFHAIGLLGLRYTPW
jgi:Ca-activated chloride channel family protein